MRKLVVAAAAVATAALAGCSTSTFDSKVDYKTSSQLPPLEVPPDLTAPARDNRFAMPDSRQSATLSGYQQERKEQGRPGAERRAGGGCEVREIPYARRRCRGLEVHRCP